MQQLLRTRKFHIGTARFNDETYNENLRWKEKKHWSGCCYGFDKKIPQSVGKGDFIFVIEMNNTTNTIMGIGLIENILIPSNRTRIYNSYCWNAYVYKSEYHISREDILKNKFNHSCIVLLERLLFYGSKHFKRGQGCVIVPLDRIATFESQIKESTKRKVYKCKICGLPKKNHVCPKKRVTLNRFNKKCALCGKTKKGHICSKLKKNKDLLNAILKFFIELF